MNMNIYVGNLPFEATQTQLEELFSQFGRVDSVRIIKDKITGNPRGFAFVQMSNKDEGQQAIDRLNGHEMLGKQLRINEARPRDMNNSGPRGGGSRGGSSTGGYNRRPRF